MSKKKISIISGTIGVILVLGIVLFFFTQGKKEKKEDKASLLKNSSVMEENSSDSSLKELESDEPSTDLTEETTVSDEPSTDLDAESFESDELEQGNFCKVHGQLKLEGTQLVDQYGEPIQLRGVSTHGIAWFPQYVNKEGFKSLRSWGTNVIRLAMYTNEYGGYMSGGNQEELKALMDSGVKDATELGMYVIIDWHILSDGNPNQYKEQAKEFFKEMSAKYAGYPNVIYEICNEPNNTSWEEVKAYADEIIPVIRENSKDAIIIVGTPTWSQDVEVAATNPVKEPYNVMYACHFYAATHKQFLRDKISEALSLGAPVFVSEFSICDASGTGGVDYEEAKAWITFMEENNLSYVQWNLANKNETSSLFRPECEKTAEWNEEDLSETGKWCKKQLEQYK